MTLYGWIIMALSVGSVSLLLIWCIVKVFTTPEESEHVHGFEQETPDIDR
ncbi:MAG: hypothetical protein ACSHX8_07760 [Opitutaceae bacterium]